MKVTPNQYYGYFDYDFTPPVFYVVVIKPARTKISEWIGSKNVKFTDLLCLDDYILSHCNFPIDWSKINAC